MPSFVNVLHGLAVFISVTKSRTCSNGNAPAYNQQPTNVYVPTFVDRTSWGATSWPSNTCPVAFTNINRITIHHTDGPQVTDYSNPQEGKDTVKNIQTYHKGPNKGYTDIGYHFLTDSIGNVYQGRPFYDDAEIPTMKPVSKDPTTYSWPRPRFIEGAHVKKHNTNNVGVSVMGCYADKKKHANDKNGCSSPNTIARYDRTYTNLVQIITYLCKYLGLEDKCVPGSDTITAHGLLKSTACPGHIKDRLEDIRTDVKNAVEGRGLCIDYSKAGTGGKCIQSSEVCNGEIISAAKNQCQSEQKCCKFGSGTSGQQNEGNNHNQGGNGKQLNKREASKQQPAKKTVSEGVSKTATVSGKGSSFGKWASSMKNKFKGLKRGKSAYMMDGDDMEYGEDEYQRSYGVYDGYYQDEQKMRGDLAGYVEIVVICGLVLFCSCVLIMVCGGVCGYMVGRRLDFGKEQNYQYQRVNPQHNVVIDA